MTPEQLKASILQYAIQGKLVEQRPEEGTAEELYMQIQDEKQKLIKEGKIKKEKPLADITDDEIPFDIPENWKWVKIQELFFAHSAMRIHQSDWVAEGIPFFRGRELVRLAKTGDPNAEIFITEDFYNQLKAKGGVPKKDDILISAVGTLGKVYVVKGTKKFYYKDAYILCLDNYGINPHYIKYMVESPYIQNYIYGNDAYGTTVAQLTLDKLKNMVIPLPPLEEQQRIVVKIEELIPYVDRYAEAYEKLEKFNAKFPEDMKKSILQYAIQGKLVEQRPEEGSAEELYKQIQEEKSKFVKEGKIKKEKPLAEITEDEIPFDIPENWKWVRVGAIFSHNTGKAMNSSAKKIDKPGAIRKFITTSNVYWNSLNLETVKEMFFSDDELERCTVTKGDLLMCEGGAYYGRTAIWNEDYDICFQNHVHRVRPYIELGLMFFYYVFYFYRNTGMMQSKGTAMPGLSSIVLHDMVVPLPPLGEQKRIVAKIEELLPYCDRLLK